MKQEKNEDEELYDEGEAIDDEVFVEAWDSL